MARPIKLEANRAPKAPAILYPKRINMKVRNNFNIPVMTEAEVNQPKSSNPCTPPEKTGARQVEASSRAKIPPERTYGIFNMFMI